MAVVSLQTSNVFSYTFSGHGNTHFNCITVNPHPSLNLGGANWTIECWIKPVNPGLAGGANWNTIFSKRSSSAGTSYEGALTPTGGVVGYFNGANFNSTTRVSPNTWNHLAYVFNNGANLRIYLNGSNVLTTTAVTTTVDRDAPLQIGIHNLASFTQQYFGDISNFRIIKGQAIYSGESFLVSAFPVQLPNNAIGPHAFGPNVAASLTGNVVLLTCNDQIIKSNGNTTFNITTSGFVYPHSVDTTELQNFSYRFPGNTASLGQNGAVLVTSTTNSLNLNTDFTIETWFYPQTNTGVLLERGYAGVGNNSVHGPAGANGGPGTPSSITGSAVTYAGGGGGGASTGQGGDGGPGTPGVSGGKGGRAGSEGPPESAVTNTGGGGGGGCGYAPLGSSPGGSGGSGIVIVRYAGAQKATGGTITSPSPGANTVHTFTGPGTFTTNAATSAIYSVN